MTTEEIDFSNYDKFVELMKQEGNNFISKHKDSNILIISHHDTDGLCSAAILEKSFEKENISFNTINSQQIDENLIENLSKNYKKEFLIFVDIGSSRLDLIKTLKNNLIIIDHHKPNEENNDKTKNITHINPFNFNIVEENMISGATMTYFFCQGINSQNKANAFLAVLGSIGDTQEKNGFQYFNNIALQHSLLQKQISISPELRLYGKNSRSLVKVLEYSTDISIPGLTNNYKGVISFLKELRIPIYWNGKPRKWYNLKDFEKEKITESILNLKSDVAIEDITVNSYKLNIFNKREFKDLRELATIINSCGRLEDYRIAIDALKANEEAQDKAIMNLRVYKSSIRDALQLFEKSKEENTLIQNEKIIIFDTNNQVKSSIVGVVASIIARNKYYEPGVIICTLSNQDENFVKISLRASQDNTELNLSELLQQIVSNLDSNAGGHPNAAGAIIPIAKKQEFIDSLLSFFN
ncbi:MAG: DHH family phosphoesterase [Candidatus Woesearchaeota archaeon]